MNKNILKKNISLLLIISLLVSPLGNVVYAEDANTNSSSDATNTTADNITNKSDSLNYIYKANGDEVVAGELDNWDAFYKHFIVELGGVRITIRDKDGLKIKVLDVYPRYTKKLDIFTTLKFIGVNNAIVPTEEEVNCNTIEDYKAAFGYDMNYSDNIPLMTKGIMSSDGQNFWYVEESADFPKYTDFEAWILKDGKINEDNIKLLFDTDLGIFDEPEYRTPSGERTDLIDWLKSADAEGNTPTIMFEPISFYPGSTQEIVYGGSFDTSKFLFWSWGTEENPAAGTADSQKIQDQYKITCYDLTGSTMWDNFKKDDLYLFENRGLFKHGGFQSYDDYGIEAAYESRDYRQTKEKLIPINKEALAAVKIDKDEWKAKAHEFVNWWIDSNDAMIEDGIDNIFGGGLDNINDKEIKVDKSSKANEEAFNYITGKVEGKLKNKIDISADDDNNLTVHVSVIKSFAKVLLVDLIIDLIADIAYGSWDDLTIDSLQTYIVGQIQSLVVGTAKQAFNKVGFAAMETLVGKAVADEFQNWAIGKIKTITKSAVILGILKTFPGILGGLGDLIGMGLQALNIENLVEIDGELYYKTTEPSHAQTIVPLTYTDTLTYKMPYENNDYWILDTEWEAEFNNTQNEWDWAGKLDPKYSDIAEALNAVTEKALAKENRKLQSGRVYINWTSEAPTSGDNVDFKGEYKTDSLCVIKTDHNKNCSIIQVSEDSDTKKVEEKLQSKGVLDAPSDNIYRYGATLILGIGKFPVATESEILIKFHSNLEQISDATGSIDEQYNLYTQIGSSEYTWQKDGTKVTKFPYTYHQDIASAYKNDEGESYEYSSYGTIIQKSDTLFPHRVVGVDL